MTCVYFCNLSKKWHLDKACLRQSEYLSELRAVKFNGGWHDRVEITSRVTLGVNIKTFTSKEHAVEFSSKYEKVIPLDMNYSITIVRFDPCQSQR